MKVYVYAGFVYNRFQLAFEAFKTLFQSQEGLGKDQLKGKHEYQ
jgi:hypothetical protein